MCHPVVPFRGDVHAGETPVITIRRAERRGEWLLECALIVDRPREEVFPFFADAINLEAITPPNLRFSILTPHPIRMGEGTLIDYRLRLQGVPMRWRTRITMWDPPVRFMDVQEKGPYRRWEHEHTFEPIEQPGSGTAATLVVDRVRYSMLAGWLVHPLFVARQLRMIFTYRQLQIVRHFRVERPGGARRDAARS